MPHLNASLTSHPVSLEAPPVKKSVSVWKWAKRAGVRRWGHRCFVYIKRGAERPSRTRASHCRIHACVDEPPSSCQAASSHGVAHARRSDLDKLLLTKETHGVVKTFLLYPLGSGQPLQLPGLKWQAIVTSTECWTPKNRAASGAQWPWTKWPFHWLSSRVWKPEVKRKNGSCSRHFGLL